MQYSNEMFRDLQYGKASLSPALRPRSLTFLSCTPPPPSKTDKAAGKAAEKAEDKAGETKARRYLTRTQRRGPTRSLSAMRSFTSSQRCSQ